MDQLLTLLPRVPTFVEVRAAGSILHDFYTATEKIFRQIAVQIDGDLPQGNDWHVQILQRMATNIPSVRPPVISEELLHNLEEYLRFRHLFRNIYGFELRWELLQGLARRLPDTQRQLAFELWEFSSFISTLAK